MKRKLKLFAWSLLVLLLIVSICINVSLVRSGSALSRLLEEKGTVILSPKQTEMLISDLESADAERMKQWRSYLHQFSGPSADHRPTRLDETFKLYQSSEKPGRSNYFNRMVFQLQMGQARARFSKQALLDYLGAPDATTEGSGVQVLDYVYWSDGRYHLATVFVTNNSVERIEIAVKPN